MPAVLADTTHYIVNVCARAVTITQIPRYIRSAGSRTLRTTVCARKPRGQIALALVHGVARTMTAARVQITPRHPEINRVVVVSKLIRQYALKRSVFYTCYLTATSAVTRQTFSDTPPVLRTVTGTQVAQTSKPVIGAPATPLRTRERYVYIILVAHAVVSTHTVTTVRSAPRTHTSALFQSRNPSTAVLARLYDHLHFVDDSLHDKIEYKKSPTEHKSDGNAVTQSSPQRGKWIFRRHLLSVHKHHHTLGIYSFFKKLTFVFVCIFF